MAAFVITAALSSATIFADTHATGETDTNKSKMLDSDPQINSNTMRYKETVTMHGGSSILGSKFIGTEIKNPQDENLGEVKDFMLDSNGKVRYVAVSYGGFLGMGDKMYAVPIEAFTFKREKDMFYDDVVLILNISKDQLENQEGFDNKNWPNLDDETYRKDLDTRYNIQSPDKSN